MGETLLEVERLGVEDGRAYVVLGKILLEFIALGGNNGVLVIDTEVFRSDSGAGYGGVSEELVIEGGYLPASPIPLVDVLELDQQNSSLDGVESEVAANDLVEIPGVLAVVAEDFDLFGKRLAVGGDQTRIAEGAEVFCRIEGKTSAVSKVSTPDIVLSSTDGLGGVFDDSQAVLCGNPADGLHRCDLAEEMNGDNGLGLRGDAGLDQIRIDIVGTGIDIDEDRGRSEACDGTGGGKESKGGGYYFVTGFDAEGHHADEQGVGAAGKADGTGGTAVVGDLAFELFDGGAQGEQLSFADGIDSGLYLGLDGSILSFEVKERNLH